MTKGLPNDKPNVYIRKNNDRLSLCYTNTIPKHQQPFRSHVKQQIDDTQVGLKTLLFFEHLVIRMREKIGNRLGNVPFRMNPLPEIIYRLRLGYIVRSRTKYGLDIQLLAHPRTEFPVEIVQELVFLFVEAMELIGIIIEERALPVSGYKSVPVRMPPVAVVRDTDILHQTFRLIRLLGRYRQRQRTVGRSDDTPVAVSLLHVMVVAFDICFLARI